MEAQDNSQAFSLAACACLLMQRAGDPDGLRRVAMLAAVQAMRSDHVQAPADTGDVQSLVDPTLEALRRLFVQRCVALGADAALFVFEDFDVKSVSFTQGLSRYALGGTARAQDLNVLGGFRRLADAQDAACAPKPVVADPS